jgi:hypothetical protein
MKKLLVSAMFLMSAQLFAQTESKPVGFGALTTTISKFNGETAVFTGTYGGWYVNKKLLIGLGGSALVSNHESANTTKAGNEKDHTRLMYGGLVTEYTLYSGNLMRYTATSMLAYGHATDGYTYAAADQWEKVKDDLFVSETSFNAEMNVAKWFRVAGGVGYRNVMGSDLAGLDNKDMRGLTGNVTLKFGWF